MNLKREFLQAQSCKLLSLFTHRPKFDIGGWPWAIKLARKRKAYVDHQLTYYAACMNFIT